MKAKPLIKTDSGYVDCSVGRCTHVMLNSPGPYATRIIPVQTKGTRKGTGNWTWNGDVDKPTLRPSILTIGNEEMPRCHSWVTGGKIQFLSDCTHELAGKTMDLLEAD